VLGAASNHDDGDACTGLDDTVRFIDSTSARAVICNNAPFLGSGIAIARGMVERTHLFPAGKGQHRFLDDWVRPPLPPLLTPLVNVITFLKRDLWRFLTALGRIPEPPSFLDFDWARAVVRQITYTRNVAPPFALIAVPPAGSHNRALLLAMRPDGALEAFKVTPHLRMVASLESAAPSLWIVPKYHGRWLPFQHVETQNDQATLRRVYDGEQITVPADHLSTATP
jgi:hypothetical protein